LQLFEKGVLVGWKLRLNREGKTNGKRGDPSLDNNESAYDGEQFPSEDEKSWDFSSSLVTMVQISIGRLYAMLFKRDVSKPGMFVLLRKSRELIFQIE
jgi:hypothetical protein